VQQRLALSLHHGIVHVVDAIEVVVTLTFAQQELVRAVLSDPMAHALVTPGQRATIRAICALREPHFARERFLIAFKIALVEAANAREIPYNPQRTAVLAQLISVFILELYEDGNGSEPKIVPQHTFVASQGSL
jgi:hypothetical protein